MRLRSLLSLALLALPLALEAQLISPRLPGRRPAPPTPIGPQPPMVSRALAYKRLNWSVESYPFLSTFQVTGDAGVLSQWTSGGFGTHGEYRLSPHASLTFDATTSFIGGPTHTATLELGTRLHPRRSERRFAPFVDVRAAVIHARQAYGEAYFTGNPFTPDGNVWQSFRASYGFGGLAGAGAEYALTRRFSLVGSASLMHSRLMALRFADNAYSDNSVNLTGMRYALALRFTPVRYVRIPTMLP